MNAATIDESGPLTVQGPGARLKTIREAQELQLQRVAVLLHLSEQKLIALEADDYTELSGSVFVQGYIRNYARLLGVPFTPLLDAYQAFNAGKERPANLHVAQVRHEVRSSHLLMRLMTWLIVIGLIALVVVWWRGYLQWPLQTGDATKPPVENAQLNTGDDTSVSLETAETDGLPPLPGLGTEEQPVEASIEIGTGETDVVPEQLTEDTAPVIEPVEMEISSPAVTPGMAAFSTSDAVAGEHAIVVEFTASCWVDIKDATGSFRLFGKKEAGERYLLEGRPPYKVVLGNAHAVKILVDNEAFDLDAHIRGNVARFSLNPE
ncbi:RodZ domain-containing protein [Candidatus Vondammii sp. HM_W22]|uniref:RodZ domain-containing protein n=1 Tax=Candidatus Vondammii sp. HM_W22 TaxID=2687299 RepID=UPI001F140C81|nr:RodZ domain-containing protein [Candidatus Vondammii sp. HM_W22]